MTANEEKVTPVADPNTGRLVWHLDVLGIFGDPPPALISVEPHQLISLLTGGLASELTPRNLIRKHQGMRARAAAINGRNGIERYNCERAMKTMNAERRKFEVIGLHESPMNRDERRPGDGFQIVEEP